MATKAPCRGKWFIAQRAACCAPHARTGRISAGRYNCALKKAGVAQSVEQLIRNEKVGCSIHLSGTTHKSPWLSWSGAFF
jgi:hypothetical protein